MYINFHLDAFTTVVDVLDWKQQRKYDLSSIFAMSLQCREYRLSKLDIKERTMQNV